MAEWNQKTQAEARRLVESLDERQWEAVCKSCTLLYTPPNEEEKEKERQRKIEFELRKKAMEADYHNFHKLMDHIFKYGFMVTWGDEIWRECIHDHCRTQKGAGGGKGYLQR